MPEEHQKRARGSGSIFQNGSAVYWIKFYERGIPRRESSHSTNRKDAEKLLKQRLAEVMTDTFVPRQNIRMDELVTDLIAEHLTNQRKSTSHVRSRWEKHLKRFFTRMRACDVTTDRIRRYIAFRQEEKASNATVNRELALLKRAFNLARECTPPKVKIVPYVPMLRESNARRNFLEGEAYAALANDCDRVGLWMRAIFELGYTYGWRHEELIQLRVRQVNLLAGSIRLDPGTTKNDQGREVAMTSCVRKLLTHCICGKKAEEHVFTRDGQPVIEFRRTWANVCCASGVGQLICPQCRVPVELNRHCNKCKKDFTRNELIYRGLIFHDLRRTAVRNMIRAGVPERVAMTISGHKTRSVFDRYHIVAQTDLADAARKLERKQAADQEAGPERLNADDFGQSWAENALKKVQTRDSNSVHQEPEALPN